MSSLREEVEASRLSIEQGLSAARAKGLAFERRIVELLSPLAPGEEDQLLARFVGDRVAEAARKTRWASLVLNPGVGSTGIAVYSGLSLLAAGELQAHGSDGCILGTQLDAVLAWFESKGLVLGEISGIATRGGMMAPVPAGTYRVCEAMLTDLSVAPPGDPTTTAASLAVALAKKIGPETIVTVTDPASVDERDALFRMTGSARVRVDRASADFLVHRAASRIVNDILVGDGGPLHLLTCHLGETFSAVRHLAGRMVQVSAAIGAMPSAAGCGALPLPDLLELIDGHRYTLDELRRDLTHEGGLLSLAGTSDFAALTEFLSSGAPPAKREKAELVRSFFAARVAGTLMELAATEAPVDVVALTGELASDSGFCALLARRFHLPVPVLRLPGSMEIQALAAGLLAAQAGLMRKTSYVEARDRLAEAREEEDRLLSTTLVDRSSVRISGPPRNLHDVLASASAGDPPVIALVGADNEEALLAVRSALMVKPRPLARFLLLGPYASVTRLAWELDVPIDGESADLVDTDDPVGTATELMLGGFVDTLMKGSCMTSAVLKGYLGYLKAAGRKRPGMLLSHLALFELPGRSGLVGVTDAAMNTSPDVEARLGILENSLAAMKLLGFERPKVAVISAVEKPSGAVVSSLEGRAIAERMAHRDDVVIEGPLSVDIALSPSSAREKKYQGRICGDADLLLVPDIDAGNAIYKAFTVISGATLGGAIIGGEAPIILTSRGDSSRTKLASVALACLLLQRGRERGAADAR
ncbi:MAG: phosphate acyltransferase [Polyangia bacterium]|nr:phosphate acyltransferase [Polyangia bacterium]